MSTEIKCPICGSDSTHAGLLGSTFECHTISFNNGEPTQQGVRCVTNQRDQLKAALKALMDFRDEMETQYANSELPGFEEAVETAKRLIE